MPYLIPTKMKELSWSMADIRQQQTAAVLSRSMSAITPHTAVSQAQPVGKPRSKQRHAITRSVYFGPTERITDADDDDKTSLIDLTLSTRGPPASRAVSVDGRTSTTRFWYSSSRSATSTHSRDADLGHLRRTQSDYAPRSSYTHPRINLFSNEVMLRLVTPSVPLNGEVQPVDLSTCSLRSRSVQRRLRRLSADHRHDVRRQRLNVIQQKLELERLKSERATERRIKAREQFLRAQSLVRSMVRFLHVMIDLSDALTRRTAVEEQWNTLNNTKEARKLAFNPAIYAKNRVYAKVPPWAKHILSRPPEVRSDEDCKRLHALLRGMRSWDKFTEKIQLAMCRAFSYEFVQSRRVILRQGHVGHNFYFIYSGSVFVNVDDVTASGEVFSKTAVVLSKGDSFGELALLSDMPRAATLTCREDCELLSVDKEVFAKLCPKIFDKELEEKVNFLSSLPLFPRNCWPKAALNSLCFEAQIQEHMTNKVVVADNARDDWLYICMQGQCRIIKCLVVDVEKTNSLTHASKRKEDGDNLTAELLQSLATASHKEDNGEQFRRTSVEVTTPLHKRRLLESMALDYVNKPKILEDDDEKEELRQKEFLEASRNSAKDGRQVAENEKKRALGDGVVTLHTLMMSRLCSTGPEQDLVYLNIGILHPTDVFDLYQVLHPDRIKTGNNIILVSSGSRLLRIKRGQFIKCLGEEALEHLRHISRQHQYPSDEVLLNSYREKSEWDAYKTEVTNAIVQPRMTQSHQYTTASCLENIQKTKQRRDSRLLSALKKSQSNCERQESVDKSEDLDHNFYGKKNYNITDMPSRELLDSNKSPLPCQQFMRTARPGGDKIIVRDRSKPRVEPNKKTVALESG